MLASLARRRALGVSCAIVAAAALQVLPAAAQTATSATVAIDSCHVKSSRGFSWFYCGVTSDANAKATISVEYRVNLTTFKPNTGGTWDRQSGTLRFGGPGQTVQNLKFAVRNLTAAQVRKRLRVTLSKPRNARITHATATAAAVAAAASTHATSPQAAAVAKAVRSTHVDDMNKVPSKRYTVTNVRISTVSKSWAMASIEPTKAYRNSFQSAIAVAVRPAGTREWVVVDVGSAQVGCGIAPNAVLADLLGLKGGETPCPSGTGIS